MRLRKVLFRTLIPGLFLAGCGSEDPNTQKLVKVEDHYVKLELTEARALLGEVQKSGQTLTERYFKNSIRVHLAAFEFPQAIQEWKRWQKLSQLPLKEEREEILSAWLLHYSEYNDVAIRFEAIRSLGDLKVFAAKDLLMQNFELPSRTVRIVVCYAMARLGDTDRAIPYLMERSRYGSLKQRALSALFLADLQDPALESVYKSFLEDPENSVRSIGASILAKLQLKDGISAIKKAHRETLNPKMKLTLAHSLVQLGEKGLISEIEAMLNDPLHSADAELILYDLGQTRHEASLVARLDSMDLESRFVMLRSMARQGKSSQVREFLLERLRSLSGSAFEKKMELELMAQVGTSEDLENIEVHMNSPFEEVRVVAIRSWWQIHARLEKEQGNKPS